ncbi:MAG: UDP-3-O-acyl-N-acetylglucosamine deacetylase [Proteobacteria bacterium]|nr:UDP-3-O-acyl-N-acetylglucosamine deacetylase [Pseudomonadota bacterium]
MRQRTLKSAISCNGVGLHTGARVSLTLRPGEPGSGIVFRRSDIGGGGAAIPARWDRVVDTTLCTTLGEGGIRVGTVEHLLAAVAGCGVDNAVVEVGGPEVPIMDGSAAPFVFLIECAGLVEQPAARRAIRVLRPVSVAHGSASASLRPAGAFGIDFAIDFANPVVGRQECSLTPANGAFKSEIARARTFGFLDDVESLRARGLARGGSLENAVVVCGERVLNQDGLRYEDEFVRHKVLDCVGDLCLAGAPLIGRFVGVQSGHFLNNRLLKALFADPDAWETVDLVEEPAEGHGRQAAAFRVRATAGKPAVALAKAGALA